MSQQATIMVVDDDPFMRGLARNALNKDWQVIEAESGEQCLAAVERDLPDVVLLDVEMTGIDGYETCRRLKENAGASVPVMFVSAHDGVPDRLRGYEAGGDDYVIKPFDPAELRAKIRSLLDTRAARSELEEKADYAGRAAMTAFTTMGEMGALLQSLRRFNTCTDGPALAEAVLAGMALYDLGGAAQVRLPEGVVTRASHGGASPLEASVIGHMAEMDRIVQFKTRLSITYDRVSLLINNMPVADADRCGRLRDHLAMLAEGAEMRAQAIVATEQSNKRGVAIGEAVVSATQTLAEIDRAQRESRMAVNLAVQDMTDAIDRAYVGLGLTDGQEAMLSEIVRKGIDSILHAQSAGTDVSDRLTALVAELNKLAAR